MKPLATPLREARALNVHQYSLRSVLPEDIQRNWNLFAPDRSLYPPDIWNILPRLWTSLLQARRIQMSIIEDGGGRAHFIGGIGFVDQRTITEAQSRDASVCATLFRLASQGRVPFLSNQQIAAENAKGSLIQLSFTGTPAIDLSPAGETSEEDAVLIQATVRSYHAHLAGYRLQSLFAEWASEMGARVFAAGGFRCIREHRLPGGGCAYLLRLETTPR